MKTPIIIYSLIILLSSCTTEQKTGYDQYDPLIWSAMSAFKDKKHEEALTYFEQAFEIFPHDNSKDLFYAAETALELMQDDLAKEYVSTAIRHHNPDSIYFVSFFAKFKHDEVFAQMKEERRQLIKEYYANLPYPKQVLDDIEQLIEKDQKPRLKNIWAQPGGTAKMMRIDSANIHELIVITKKHGWFEKAWIVLWHQRGTYGQKNEVWNYFKPFIDKEIEKGRVRKSFWAQFDDGKSVSEEGQQIYGMYQNQSPIIDIEQVDERRAEVGLPPLWYMNKVHNWDLPEGYTGKPKT